MGELAVYPRNKGLKGVPTDQLTRKGLGLLLSFRLKKLVLGGGDGPVLAAHHLKADFYLAAHRQGGALPELIQVILLNPVLVDRIFDPQDQPPRIVPQRDNGGKPTGGNDLFQLSAYFDPYFRRIVHVLYVSFFDKFFLRGWDHSHPKKNLQEEFLFFQKKFFGSALDKTFRHKKPGFPSEKQNGKSLRVPATPVGLEEKIMPLPPVIVWFRRDLRVSDHTALHRAAATGAPVVPVFVFDPAILGAKDTGSRRTAFLLECLQSLEGNLAHLGATMLFLKGHPDAALRALAKDTGARKIFFNKDVEPYSRKRDEKVAKMAKEEGLGGLRRLDDSFARKGPKGCGRPLYRVHTLRPRGPGDPAPGSPAPPSQVIGSFRGPRHSPAGDPKSWFGPL
ncbi:MAG: deoxyribodipyrimidine photo-lyase [Verrucomicrobia bacterium]|nr:deoxyribodipyrimidine photo-lyase [Verrucomicrobiota bacterium]